MDLTTLQRSAAQGWNTLYNDNILTHVLMPWGFAITLSFRKKSSGDTLRSLLVNREAPVRPEIRSMDGSYTCLHIRHGNTPIKIESTSTHGEQIILVTPEGYYTSDELLKRQTRRDLPRRHAYQAVHQLSTQGLSFADPDRALHVF